MVLTHPYMKISFPSCRAHQIARGHAAQGVHQGAVAKSEEQCLQGTVCPATILWTASGEWFQLFDSIIDGDTGWEIIVWAHLIMFGRWPSSGHHFASLFPWNEEKKQKWSQSFAVNDAKWWLKLWFQSFPGGNSWGIQKGDSCDLTMIWLKLSQNKYEPQRMWILHICGKNNVPTPRFLDSLQHILGLLVLIPPYTTRLKHQLVPIQGFSYIMDVNSDISQMRGTSSRYLDVKICQVRIIVPFWDALGNSKKKTSESSPIDSHCFVRPLKPPARRLTY